MLMTAARWVDTLHVLWVVVWVGLAVLSFRSRKAATVLHFMTWPTLATQVAFLGCPLTMLSMRLRGATYTGSATGAIPERLTGIRLSPSVIASATVVIYALTAFGIYRKWYREKDSAC